MLECRPLRDLWPQIRWVALMIPTVFRAWHENVESFGRGPRTVIEQAARESSQLVARGPKPSVQGVSYGA